MFKWHFHILIFATSGKYQNKEKPLKHQRKPGLGWSMTVTNKKKKQNQKKKKKKKKKTSEYDPFCFSFSLINSFLFLASNYTKQPVFQSLLATQWLTKKANFKSALRQPPATSVTKEKGVLVTNIENNQLIPRVATGSEKKNNEIWEYAASVVC